MDTLYGPDATNQVSCAINWQLKTLPNIGKCVVSPGLMGWALTVTKRSRWGVGPPTSCTIRQEELEKSGSGSLQCKTLKKRLFLLVIKAFLFFIDDHEPSPISHWDWRPGD